MSELARSVEIEPKVSESHYLLGLAYLCQGSNRLAESEVETAVVVGGDYSRVSHLRRACVLAGIAYSLREFERAARLYGECFDVASYGGLLPYVGPNGSALTLRAVALERGGRIEEARVLMTCWVTRRFWSACANRASMRGVWGVAIKYLLGDASEEDLLREPCPGEDLLYVRYVALIPSVLRGEREEAVRRLRELLDAASRESQMEVGEKRTLLAMVKMDLADLGSFAPSD